MIINRFNHSKNHITLIVAIVTLVLLGTVMPAFAQDSYGDLSADKATQNSSLLEIASEDVRFDTLVLFLKEQGYHPKIESSVFTVVNNLQTSTQVIDVDIDIVLVPFDGDGLPSARIAYWRGHWENEFHSGTMATIGEKETYLLDGDRVIRVNSHELENYLDVPLYAIPGPVPPDMPEITITERETNGFSNANYKVYSDFGLNSGCKWVGATRIGYSATGLVVWKFHHDKHFCYDGSQVYNIHMTVSVSDLATFVWYRGLVASYEGFQGHNNYGHYSVRQGHLEQCVSSYGCIFSAYPGVRLDVYGNSQWSHSTWD